MRRDWSKYNGGVQVHQAMGDAVHPQGVGSHPGKAFALSLLVQHVQRPAQTVVMEYLGRQPRTQQAVQGLVGEELRRQVKGTAGEARRFEDHRLHRFPDAGWPGPSRRSFYSARPISWQIPATMPR